MVSRVCVTFFSEPLVDTTLKSLPRTFKYLPNRILCLIKAVIKYRREIYEWRVIPMSGVSYLSSLVLVSLRPLSLHYEM